MTPLRPADEETRARQRIRRAAQRGGLTVDWIEWVPIGGGVEMMGPDGGWTVALADGRYAFGLNLALVLGELGHLAAASRPSRETPRP